MPTALALNASVAGMPLPVLVIIAGTLIAAVSVILLVVQGPAIVVAGFLPLGRWRSLLDIL